MIPFIPPPELRIGPFHLGGMTIGPISLYGFGMCVAMAILFGSWMYRRRAVRLGLEEDEARDLLYYVFIGGFVGAHLVDVLFYRPERLMREPLLLFKVWSGISSFGGFLGAFAGVLLFVRRHELTRQQYWGHCEALIFALPFGWIFGRLGCSLAHDHPGIKSDFFLAIQTPPLAYQGAPHFLPNGPFLDLGFLEFLYTILLWLLLLFLDRKRRPIGFYITIVPLLYAPVRFTLDFFRTVDVRYFGLTPGQYVAIGLVVFSLWLWRRRPHKLYGFHEEKAEEESAAA